MTLNRSPVALTGTIGIYAEQPLSDGEMAVLRLACQEIVPALAGEARIIDDDCYFAFVPAQTRPAGTTAPIAIEVGVPTLWDVDPAILAEAVAYIQRAVIGCISAEIDLDIVHSGNASEVFVGYGGAMLIEAFEMAEYNIGLMQDNNT